MKRVFWTALLALAFCAQPARAQCCNPCDLPIRLDFCFGGCHLGISAGGGRTQLGPWYQYWPYQAHFQQPPPLGGAIPGPSYMTMAPAYGSMAPAYASMAPAYASMPSAYGQYQWAAAQPVPTPATPVASQAQRPLYQPVGYFYQGAAPSYWYGR